MNLLNDENFCQKESKRQAKHLRPTSRRQILLFKLELNDLDEYR